jgi:glutathione S-transferase
VQGNNDVIIPTMNSYVLQQRLPNAQLIIYPDAHHGSFLPISRFVHETRNDLPRRVTSSGREGRASSRPNLEATPDGEATKLYHNSGSPNSPRVRIFIAEKGLGIDLVPVDLGAKEQFSEAYRSINSSVVVPTLVIGEVPAIMRYLDEAYPAVPLLGSTPNEQAIIAMWERRTELEGFAPVMEGVRNAVERLKGRAIAGPPRLRANPGHRGAQQAAGGEFLRRLRGQAEGGRIRRRRSVVRR